MRQPSKTLSSQAAEILQQIANGRSYEQILANQSRLNYRDIFDAAREAIEITQSGHTTYQVRMKKIKGDHPRAYEPWSTEEDDELKALVSDATPVCQIAKELQRQPGAIHSRINKLGLSLSRVDSVDSPCLEQDQRLR